MTGKRWLSMLALGILVQANPAGAVDFDCLVNPSMVLKIGSPVSSTLDSVSVDRGSVVHKGQELARLETGVEAASVALRKARAESVADVVSHQAKVDAAQLEVQRAAKQTEGLTVTSQKVAELKTTLQVAQQDLAMSVLDQQMAQLELARARAELEQRIIRSPIDGVVTERLLGPGEYVHPDTHIVSLAAIDPLFVEAYPPVRYHDAIHIGDTGTVSLDDGTTRTAKVTVVDRVFDAGSGTFGIRLDLPNPGLALAAGTRCKLTFGAPNVSASAHP
jgi:RND family efflux transporter MFP subunit